MKHLQSAENPFYKMLRKLADSARERKKLGKTLLDSAHLIEAYQQVHGPVETLVVAASRMERLGHDPELAALLALADERLVVLADGLFRALGVVETPTGLMAVVPIPSSNESVKPDQATVLLDGIQDPGNLGTLLRTAAAAGVTQILLSPECTSAWSPKVLRAAQGAHFLLTMHEAADLAEFMAGFAGTTLVTALEGAEDLFAAQWTPPLAWVFGSEGRGVSPALLALATQRIKIPMPGAVESLNVGAAAAICLFESVRRAAIIHPS